MTKQRKKILYIITQTEFGGAQKYIFDLAKNLPQEKFEAEVAVGKPGHGWWLNELEEKGIKTWHLSHVQRNINPWHNTMSIFEIAKICKKTKPDTVHLNSSMVGFTGAVAAKLAGVKNIVYTVHGLVLNDPRPFYQKWIFWFFEFLGNLMTTHIICVSEYDKKSILKYKLASPKKISVIHNGIDIDDIEYLSQKNARLAILPGEYENYNWIGTIANFYPTKGLKYLVTAAKTVIKQKPETLFVIIGKGGTKKEKRNILNQIAKSGLSKNFVIKELSPAANYIPAFNMFVLPSLKEGLPVTLIEALAAGIPIVATKVGGIPEIIENEKNGLLVEPKNSQYLSDAILKLINNKKDYSKENIKKAQEFSLEKLIKNTIEKY